MGVFKRYRDAQAAQTEAANAVPGAYQSSYTDRINQTLDALGAGADEAADVGTDSQLYRQYRGNATQNARAAAENAAAGAAALSGGYGSSYANSAAQQGYQQEMANVDNGLAGLREKALSEYQLKKSGLAQLFSGLVNQDSLEAAEHQTAVSNAQSWRDYKLNRASQAASEKEGFLNRSVQNISNIVGAIQQAYDLYKGYDFQQQQLDMQDRQLAAQEEEAKWNGIEQGWKYKNEEGWSDDALNQYLSRWDVDSNIYDGWTTGNEDAGLSLDQYIKLATTASSLIEDGQVGAAQDLYRTAGIDPSILNTSIQTAAGRSGYGSSGGSSRRSGSSSGSSGTSGNPFNLSGANILSLKQQRDEKAAKGEDTTWEDWMLAQAQAPVNAGRNLLETNQNSTGSTKNSSLQWETPGEVRMDMPNKYGTPVDTSKTSKSIPEAVTKAKGYAAKGYNNSAIVVKLQHEGYSNAEITKIFNEAGL